MNLHLVKALILIAHGFKTLKKWIFKIMKYLGYSLIIVFLIYFFVSENWTAFIATITVIFIGLQYHYNKILTRFTCMPRVAFTVRSGKNDYFRKKGKTLSKLKIKLNTRFLVKNNSDFPIYFLMKIIKLEIKYRDKEFGKEKIDNNIKYKWFVFPHARLNGQDEGEILYKNILSKSKLNNTDETENILKKKLDDLNDNDEKILEEKIMNKIESVGAEIKISFSPAYQENFHFDIPSEMWPFVFKDEEAKEGFVWRTPRSGVSDYNVTFYEDYKEVYNY